MGKSSKKPRSMTTLGDKEGGWEKRSTWERDRITAKRDAERRAAKRRAIKGEELNTTDRHQSRAELKQLANCRLNRQTNIDNGGKQLMQKYRKSVVCCECGSRGEAVLTPGTVIYPHAAAHMPYVKVNYWRCACGAYVGCHPDSSRPLGHCGGKELRTLRGQCHKVFDAMWRPSALTPPVFPSRADAYRWLTEKLREAGALHEDDASAHIGHLNLQEALICLQIVVEHAAEIAQTKERI